MNTRSQAMSKATGKRSGPPATPGKPSKKAKAPKSASKKEVAVDDGGKVRLSSPGRGARKSDTVASFPDLRDRYCLMVRQVDEWKNNMIEKNKGNVTRKTAMSSNKEEKPKKDKKSSASSSSSSSSSSPEEDEEEEEHVADTVMEVSEPSVLFSAWVQRVMTELPGEKWKLGTPETDASASTEKEEKGNMVGLIRQVHQKRAIELEKAFTENKNQFDASKSVLPALITRSHIPLSVRTACQRYNVADACAGVGRAMDRRSP
jgi:hypothetical protein